jgi:Zn-finger nucleic acid-binding protein
MNCPKCAVALTPKKLKGRQTEVDFCSKCQGIWFDDGELSSAIGVPARVLSPSPNARETAVMCPRCTTPLVVFPYPGTMTVIDGCRTCRGVWLDGGEFQELSKVRPAQSASAAPAVKRPAPPPKPETTKTRMINFINTSIESLWAGIRAPRS